uniref:Piwi domain-containing protein n=1 Tax=Drosophila pseudoobscura pseudoobscura TaxID=46245 RepID=A0A0R3P2L0_DROPS
MMTSCPSRKSSCKRSSSYTLSAMIFPSMSISTTIASGSANQLDNPLPGTLVDEHITRAHMYDFFLVSQLVRQGTVSPTHFIVLQDDAKYGPDIIQKLSYKLCFLYYNWSGTIRIPACCMAK